MNRNILMGIILVIGVVAGGWWYFIQSNAPTVSDVPSLGTNEQSVRQEINRGSQTIGTDQSTTQPPMQSQLAKDLADITPQFLDIKEDSSGAQVLSSELEKIKNDVELILIGPGPHDSSVGPSVLLNAVGRRYVELTITQPTDAGSSPQILDSVTLESSNFISGFFQFVVGKTAVYVSATDICTYTLDQSSCVPLSGAKLSGGEVYGDDSGMGGYFDPQDLTYTNTSMTIAVLAWVNPYTNQAKFQKLRDITLPLP